MGPVITTLTDLFPEMPWPARVACEPEDVVLVIPSASQGSVEVVLMYVWNCTYKTVHYLKTEFGFLMEFTSDANLAENSRIGFSFVRWYFLIKTTNLGPNHYWFCRSVKSIHSFLLSVLFILKIRIKSRILRTQKPVKKQLQRSKNAYNFSDPQIE